LVLPQVALPLQLKLFLSPPLLLLLRRSIAF
jgi:hypothetical protein